MKFPQDLIEHFGGAQDFAEAASRHPKAPPRRLRRSAVYAWKVRGTVPYMWRPVIDGLREEIAPQEAAE